MTRESPGNEDSNDLTEEQEGPHGMDPLTGGYGQLIGGILEGVG